MEHILKSWESLNKFVITADEEDCKDLLALETAGKGRRTFLLRIHSRLNKVRRARERKQIGE